MNKKDITTLSSSPLSGLREISRFGDFFSQFEKLWNSWDMDVKTFTDLQPKFTFPKVNVVETDTAYEVEIALAGFSKEDISLELQYNCLHIKANRQEEEISDNSQEKKYLLREISYRSTKRTVAFQKKICPDKVSCSHKDGIITCIVEKEPLIKVDRDHTFKITIN